jgi:hypothetical protein
MTADISRNSDPALVCSLQKRRKKVWVAHPVPSFCGRLGRRPSRCTCWTRASGKSAGSKYTNIRDPILTGILKVIKLPVQSTFWRFINALHRNVARQILTIMRTMRERVWEAANVQLEVVTIDTDTTVHTLYGQQMGGRKGYNPKNKGKKSYQPMLTFIAETREYVWGELRNGDRPSDPRSSAKCAAGLAIGRKADLRPGRFGLLLPGSRRSV